MEIFHYVADQLKDTPNFNTSIPVESNELNKGAVFNDFDFESASLLRADECTHSYSQVQVNRNESMDVPTMVPQEALDRAILAADDEQGF